MIPTAALRQSQRPAPVDPDCAAYAQGAADAVTGVLWILEDRLRQPLAPSVKGELLRLRSLLRDREGA
jgi:hypothetical protein